MKLKLNRPGFLLSILSIGLASANAALTVKVAEPKQIGQKTVIKLTLQNTLSEQVESVRA